MSSMPNLTGPEHQQQFLINNLLTPQQLELKLGARVMFTVNSAEGGFVNGQTGIVTEFGHRIGSSWSPRGGRSL